MSARTIAPTLRRIGTAVDRGAVDELDPSGVRLLLRALLFEGAGVPSWHALAACRETDGSVFFPETDATRWADIARAKRVCADCPVRGECLSDALAWEMDYARSGVLGGLTPGERHRLYVRQRDEQAHERAAGGERAA